MKRTGALILSILCLVLLLGVSAVVPSGHILEEAEESYRNAPTDDEEGGDFSFLFGGDAADTDEAAGE